MARPPPCARARPRLRATWAPLPRPLFLVLAAVAAEDGAGDPGRAIPSFTDWAPINAVSMCRLPHNHRGACAGHDVQWGVAAPEVPTGPFAAPAIGDLDGDGRADLLVGEQSAGAASGLLWVRFGKQGGLGEAVRLEEALHVETVTGEEDFPGLFPRPALGDIDGDNVTDLVLVTLRKQQPGIRVFLGEPGGLREAQGEVGKDLRDWADHRQDETEPPYRLTIGDWDGDGRMDVVVGDLDAAPLFIFLNEGGGRLRRTGEAFRHQKVKQSWPALGDLNRDGIADLVVASSAGRPLVWMGGGGGRFYPVSSEAEDIFVANESEADWPGSAPALGDVDGDGLLDVVFGTPGRLQLTILLARRVQQFRPLTVGNPLRGIAAVEPPASPALHDLNGDGCADLVLAEDHEIGWWARVWVSTPSGFKRAGDLRYFTGKSPAAALGDLDNDGSADLVVGFQSGGRGHLLRFDPRPGGGFEQAGWIVRGLQTFMIMQGNNPRPALHDLNGDGRADLILLSNNDRERRMTVWINLPGGFLRAKVSEAVGLVDGPRPWPAGAAPTVGDVDGDGLPDVLVTFSGGMRLLRGRADGSFAQVADGDESNPLHGLLLGRLPLPALGDLDGDGVVELVVGSASSRALAVFRAGACQHSCGQMGACRRPDGVCECFARAAGQLCEGCAAGYFGRDCQPCPGVAAGLGPCNWRGSCDDERAAKAKRDKYKPFGSGKCECVSPFRGTDCSTGGCPAGSVPSFDRTSLLQFCLECPPLAQADADHTGCACMNGTVQLSGSAPEALQCGCERGRVRILDARTSAFECRECPAGRFQPILGAIGLERCHHCPPLASSNEPRTACECHAVRLPEGGCGCAEGYVRVAAETGSRPGLEAPTGSPAEYYCHRCPDGTVQPHRGAVGLAMCLPCPEKREASDDQLECVCANGTLDLTDAGEGCSKHPCHLLGTGGVACVRPNLTLAAFETAAGYYRLPGRPMLPVRCRVPSLCIGGPIGDACAPGAAGPECMTCASQDWYKVSPTRGCQQCSLSLGVWLGVTLTLLGAAAVLFRRSWREELLGHAEELASALDRQVAFIVPKVLMTAHVFQKFNAASRLQNTSEVTRQALTQLSVFSLDFWTMSHLTTCAFGVGYLGQYLLQLATLAAVAAATVMVARLTDANVASACLFLFRLTHMPVLTSTLRLFACDGKLQDATREARERFGDHEDEAPAYLVEDYRIQCRGRRYLLFQVLGTAVLCLWSVGIVTCLLLAALSRRQLLNPKIEARQVAVSTAPDEVHVDVMCRYREHIEAAEVLEELHLRECLTLYGVRETVFAERPNGSGRFTLGLGLYPPRAAPVSFEASGGGVGGVALAAGGPGASDLRVEAAAALYLQVPPMDVLQLAQVKLRLEAAQRDAGLRVLAPLYRHCWPRAWWYGLFTIASQVGYCALFLLPVQYQGTVSAIFAVAMLLVTGYVGPYIRRSDNLMATVHHACVAVLFIAQDGDAPSRWLVSIACVATPALLLVGMAAYAYVLPCRRLVWAEERAHQAMEDELLRRASAAPAARPARVEPACAALRLAACKAAGRPARLRRLSWWLRDALGRSRGAPGPRHLEEGALVALPDGRRGTVWHAFPGLDRYAVAVGFPARVERDGSGEPRLFAAADLRLCVPGLAQAAGHEHELTAMRGRGRSAGF